jgi:anaerobic magnesium-protoporphyrin IX monomethyl ester cyclase
LKIIEVSSWTHRHHALSPELNFSWNEVAIIELLFPGVLGLTAYKERLREITRDSNAIFLQVIEDTSYVFSDGRPRLWSAQELRSQCESFLNELTSHRDAFILRNQDLLLETLRRETRAAV